MRCYKFLTNLNLSGGMSASDFYFPNLFSKPITNRHLILDKQSSLIIVNPVKNCLDRFNYMMKRILDKFIMLGIVMIIIKFFL
jgi:hypothetical protein